VLPGFDLAVREGEFLTLLGPSRCGKTTLLRLLAGFEAPDAGEILLDGTDLAGLPPERRPVNVVFQSYALFPHLDVFENVAFGLRMQGIRHDERGERVAAALAMVRLAGLERRRPHQLSGGQQQRVALARAVVNRPRVLLLDECLNALDLKLRQEMQVELKQLHARLGLTFLYVTHDQEEALAMSDRVVVMRDGRIEQLGTPREVYETPVSLFVAGFVGEINVFDAMALGEHAEGGLLAEVEGQPVRLPAAGPVPAGAPLKVLLRPEDLRLAPLVEGEMPAVGFAGSVMTSTYKGKTLDSLVRLDSGRDLRVSEFFDEDDPSFDYRYGERVAVTWVAGWETVVPDDG
jgi:spermidine/putrescine transport system ATP-binding protein